MLQKLRGKSRIRERMETDGIGRIIKNHPPRCKHDMRISIYVLEINGEGRAVNKTNDRS